MTNISENTQVTLDLKTISIIVVANSFIHVDTDKDKSQNIIWTY